MSKDKIAEDTIGAIRENVEDIIFGIYPCQFDKIQGCLKHIYSQLNDHKNEKQHDYQEAQENIDFIVSALRKFNDHQSPENLLKRKTAINDYLQATIAQNEIWYLFVISLHTKRLASVTDNQTYESIKYFNTYIEDILKSKLDNSIKLLDKKDIELISGIKTHLADSDLPALDESDNEQVRQLVTEFVNSTSLIKEQDKSKVINYLFDSYFFLLMNNEQRQCYLNDLAKENQSSLATAIKTMATERERTIKRLPEAYDNVDVPFLVRKGLLTIDQCNKYFTYDQLITYSICYRESRGDYNRVKDLFETAKYYYLEDDGENYNEEEGLRKLGLIEESKASDILQIDILKLIKEKQLTLDQVIKLPTHNLSALSNLASYLGLSFNGFYGYIGDTVNVGKEKFITFDQLNDLSKSYTEFQEVIYKEEVLMDLIIKISEGGLLADAISDNFKFLFACKANIDFTGINANYLHQNIINCGSIIALEHNDHKAITALIENCHELLCPETKNAIISKGLRNNASDILITLVINIAYDLDHDQKYGILFAAANNGNLALLKNLLSLPLNFNIQNDYGATALHCAVINGHKEVACLLVRKGGADPEIEDGEGRTPLSLCIDESFKRDLLFARCHYSTENSQSKNKRPLQAQANNDQIKIARVETQIEM